MNDNIDNLLLLDKLEIADELDDLCASSELSLTALQEILNRLDKNDSIGNYIHLIELKDHAYTGRV